MSQAPVCIAVGIGKFIIVTTTAAAYRASTAIAHLIRNAHHPQEAHRTHWSDGATINLSSDVFFRHDDLFIPTTKEKQEE
jgi:hypothetical protein